MRTITLPLLTLLALTACVEQIYQDSIAEFPPGADGAASSTSEPPLPTTSEATSVGPGVQTVTGDVDSTGPGSTSDDPGSSSGSTGEAPVNLPPTIELFAVTPAHLGEAGPAELQLVVSEDVVAVQLSLDGVKLADLKPGDFPRKWDALSAKDNGAARIFEVVVKDAEGLSAAETTAISVQLPQPGIEKCIFEDKDANLSVISALKYTNDAIIAVGTRDTGAGLRLTAWKLDPDHCKEVLPGWPQTIANWSAQPGLAAMTSRGAAVDVDLDGNIVVAGNFIVGGKPQSYVTLLNQAGSQLWEKVGQVGDEVAGVAAATAQFKNRVFVVGSQQTSDVPVRTDAAIWTYLAIDGKVYVGSSLTLKAPFTPDEFEPDDENKYSERVRAVVIQPGTGNALAVGEREFSPDGLNLYSRAFTLRVHPLGGIVGAPWTSWAPSFVHDAVRSVALCGDSVLAGGWTRDEPPGAKPQPMMFWIEGDGTSVKHRDEPQLGSTEINGIACDREAKIISAATRELGSRDALVFTAPGQDGPRTMYETGTVGDDGAGAVACDRRGFCGWGGHRTVNGKVAAVTRVHHP
jgi:hypothetical protein